MKLEPVHGSPTMPPLKLASVLNQKQQQQQHLLHQQQQQQQLFKMEQEDVQGTLSHTQPQSQRSAASILKVMEAADRTGNELEMENDAMYENGEEETPVAADGSVLPHALKVEKPMQLEHSKQHTSENGEMEEESSSSIVGSGSGSGGSGSKKKGQRKKRSMNWEEAERSLLVDIIKPKVDFIENRSVDTKNIKTKRLSWIQISKQFNSLNFRQRSLEQIQVQWRSMKNSAKREFQVKHPKLPGPLEGLQMLEFMEEMQKELVGATRSQTRSLGVQQHKKEPMEVDEEDTPLAALPNTNTIISNSGSGEDTLPSSAAITGMLSPPNSTEATDAQNIQMNGNAIGRKKGNNQLIASENSISQSSNNYKTKRQKNSNAGTLMTLNNLNPSNVAGPMSSLSVVSSLLSAPPATSILSSTAASLSSLSGNASTVSAINAGGQFTGGSPNLFSANASQYSSMTTTALTPAVNTGSNSMDLKTISSTNASHSTNNTNAMKNYISIPHSGFNVMPPSSTSPPLSPLPTSSAFTEDKYKRQLFDLIKRARLAEIDFVRKEHEQKLRFEQEEQELKMRHMCELHEQRMRLALNEHEMRMQAYTIHIGKINLPSNEQLDI